MMNELVDKLFGDKPDIVKAFADIDAIEFKYNELAHQLEPDGAHGVDDDVHIGIKAQDLEKNPVTSACVETMSDGYKAVNTGELTLANSAVLSEICKRIENIENILGVK